jgi:hypothetical protein
MIILFRKRIYLVEERCVWGGGEAAEKMREMKEERGDPET